MKNLNKLQNLVIILMILSIATIAIYTLITFIPKNQVTKEQEKIKYNYVLYERDSSLYEDIFNNLKSTLNEDTIDYEKYATYVSELFIIDFYTLNNKTSKNDVGGLQYLYKDIKENFILKASDTIYKYVGTKENRIIELPTVSEIELVNIEESEYKIGDITYDSYKVKLNWNYSEDLGYDKSGTITLIKEDNKLYIIEKSE